MAEELKPCPFCGGKAVVTFKRNSQSYDGQKGGHRIECENRMTTCSMNMRTHHASQERKAVKAWNKRV